METLADIQDEIKSIKVLFRNPKDETGEHKDFKFIKGEGINIYTKYLSIPGTWSFMPILTMLNGRIISMEPLKLTIHENN